MRCLLLLAAMCGSVGAAPFPFRNGAVELVFDDQTGALLRIACRGDIIAEDAPNRSPVSFGIGTKDKQTWLVPRRGDGHPPRLHLPHAWGQGHGGRLLSVPEEHAAVAGHPPMAAAGALRCTGSS
jgi:hypothetical protein